MPPKVLIGWILLFLAAVIGAITLARFARNGNAPARGVFRSPFVHHGSWVAAATAGAIMVSGATGPTIYTAVIALAMLGLWAYHHLNKQRLGQVLLRSGPPRLRVLLLIAAFLMLAEVVDQLIRGWSVAADLELDTFLLPLAGILWLRWGLSRWEVRARGIVTTDAVLPWEAIATYGWGGKDGRRLILRRRQPGPAWAAKETRGLQADEVAPFDQLLAAHLTAEESGFAAPVDHA